MKPLFKWRPPPCLSLYPGGLFGKLQRNFEEFRRYLAFVIYQIVVLRWEKPPTNCFAVVLKCRHNFTEDIAN